MAQIRNEDVLIVLSQVLADLVRGEFQQLQNKSDSSERFQLYLEKTFNKTASLIAYSAKANGILASSYLVSIPIYICIKSRNLRSQQTNPNFKMLPTGIADLKKKKY